MINYTTFYILRILNDDFFVSGTGAKFVWNVEDKAIESDDNGDLFDTDARREKAREDGLDNFAEELYKTYQTECGGNALGMNRIVPSSEAAEILTKYHQETRREAVKKFNSDVLDPSVGVISKIAVTADRFAALHSVGCGKKLLDGYDAEWGVAKAKHSLESYFKLQELKLKLPTEDTEKVKDDISRLTRTLKKYGGETTIGVIERSNKWLEDKAKKIVSSAKEMEIVDFEYKKDATKPAMYVWLVKEGE